MGVRRRLLAGLLAATSIALGLPLIQPAVAAEGFWSSRRVTQQNLNDVSFPTREKGWAVGAGGTILRTGDGGATWAAQSSPVSISLTAVDFPTVTSGWAVGGSDTVLSTTNGGVTWTKSSTGTGANFQDVEFIDESHGWAGGFSITRGQVIIATDNGGKTWTEQIAPAGFGIFDISFFDTQRGFAVGPLDATYRTTDGGDTWIPMVINPEDQIYSVRTTGPSSGIAAGYMGGIYRTADAGASWERVAQSDAVIRALDVAGDAAFAVGDQGFVASSDDAGQTWEVQSSGTIAALMGVSAPSPVHAVAVGQSGTIATFAGSSNLPRSVPLDLAVGDDVCQGVGVSWRKPGAGTPVDVIPVDIDGVPGDEIVIGGPEGVRALRPFANSVAATIWSLPLQLRVQQLQVAELDGDDGSEIIFATAAQGASKDGVVAIDAATGAVIWSARVSSGARQLRAGDLDGDGIDEVVVFGNLNPALTTLSGADGSLLRSPRPLQTAGTDAEIADLDGDGDLDVVVVTEGGKVLALDGPSGSALWTYQVAQGTLDAVEVGELTGDGSPDVAIGGSGSPVSLIPGSNDNSTTIGTRRGAFVAGLHGSDGRRLWDYADPGSMIVRAVALTDLTGDGIDDVVAHANTVESGSLFALDGRGLDAAGNATGEPKQVWHLDTSPGSIADQHINSSESIATGDADRDGVPDVYVGLGKGRLVAASGKAEGTRGLIQGSPATTVMWDSFRSTAERRPWFLEAGDERYVLSANDDHLVALRDAATGKVLWAYDGGGGPVVAHSDVDSDGSPEVGVGTSAGRFYVLEANGAEVGASKDLFFPQRIVGVSPAHLGGTAGPGFVAASADGTVRGISGVGESVWTLDGDGSVTSLAGGRAVSAVGTDDGRVVGINNTTGEIAWMYSFGGSDAISSIAYSGTAGTFAAGDVSGRLRILDPAGQLIAAPAAAGPVSRVVAGDVDGDGVDEFVVAAGSAFEAFRDSGTSLWRTGAGRPVGELTLGDLDGTTGSDIVGYVLGGAVALRGDTGGLLWEIDGLLSSGGVAAVDLDGDGSDEALIGSYDYFGRGGKIVSVAADGTRSILCTVTKTPKQISAIDLDSDGFTEPMLAMDEGDIVALQPLVPRDGTPEPKPTPTVSNSAPPVSKRGIYTDLPNDRYFSDQWGPKKIGAPQAWQRPSATGYGIKVAVVDTGIDLSHEDLQCPGKLQVTGGSDLIGDGGGPDDGNGHGTHVAGIIGACTNNGIGTSGVAPDATLLPFQVLGANGSGGAAGLEAGIRRAADAGAHVINMSLGFGPFSGVPGFYDELEREVGPAIEYAVGHGAVVIAAAGNRSMPLCEFPALNRNIICVGATDRRDLKSWYSSFAEKEEGPTVVAPGGAESLIFCDLYSEDILSLYAMDVDKDSCDRRKGYATVNGTSMAAPHVAGVAALVYDRLGGERTPRNAAAVIEALIGTAKDLGAPGYDPMFGSGRVDASAAVCAVGVPCETTAPKPTTSTAHSGTPSCVLPGIDDRCETWAAVYDDPSTAPGSYQLEPRLAASDDGERVFMSTIDQRKNPADPSNSPASWTVLGYDGQTGAQRWKRTYSGPGNYDRPNALTSSRDGSLVIATGGSYDAPVMTAKDRDLVTIAYDGDDGSELWRTRSSGPIGDVGTEVLLSRDERQVFVVVNVNNGGGDIDWAVVAYDAATGLELWRTPYAGLGLKKVDSPKAAALSPSGELLYVTGESGAAREFDADYATVAYATTGAGAGSVVWEARYDGGKELSDRASDLAVDVDGRVIVTGDSLISNEVRNVDIDYATVAYDGLTGQQQWVTHYAGPVAKGLDFGRTVATSPDARVALVSGQSAGGDRDYDWATLAYDTTTGAQLWATRLSTPNHKLEFANDMAVSDDGTTGVVTGISGGTNLTNYRDLNRSYGITVGYDMDDGALQWSARLTGNDETDSFSPRGVLLADDGSAFVAGQLTNNMQLDYSDNVYDAMLVSYRNAGGGASPTPDPTGTPTQSPSPSVSPSPSESAARRGTQLVFTERSAESTEYSDESLFEAHLSSGGEPLGGQELVFDVTGPDGSSTFSALTDDQGLGSVTPVLDERPGTYELTVRYAGTEDTYEGSADSMSFVVEREDTASTLRIEGNGDNKTLISRLADADTDASGIGARTIEFFSDGSPIGTATTGDDGVARLLIPAGHRGNKRTYEARFPGDSFYIGSSAAVGSGKPKNAV